MYLIHPPFGDYYGSWRVMEDLHRRGVLRSIVGSDRMAENLDVFGFELTDDEMRRIATLDLGRSMFFDHRDPEHVARLNSRQRNP